MNDKPLSLVVDMFGCPNRCKHCWIGHMPNRKMDEDSDIWIVDFFKPYFKNIEYYSWLREPDYCDDYRQRWERDKRISVGTQPQRFELASFWRIVRDPQYVKFLKEVGVKKVQLTFFGTEEMTDKYVGRKGAFNELIKASEILLENKIAPRWQAFINEENKNDIINLLRLADIMKLKEKCNEFGSEFKFIVHSGSCDGENRKLYGIRINKENIPSELLPYYLNYDNVLSEQECCRLLKNDSSRVVYHNSDRIVLNISNTYDIYFNFTHMTDVWRIGNLKNDDPDEIVRRIISEDIPALALARNISVGELTQKYGDFRSQKVFFIDDYKTYLLNAYLENAMLY